jgi:hypothetical protein
MADFLNTHELLWTYDCVFLGPPLLYHIVLDNGLFIVVAADPSPSLGESAK